MNLRVSLAIYVFFIVGVARAQDSNVPPSSTFPHSPGSAPMAPAVGWPGGSTNLTPEALETYRSQMATTPPGFPASPGVQSGAPSAPLPGAYFQPPGAPPMQQMPGLKPATPEPAKPDRAAEKAREQMRKALRESALEMQREAEKAKSKRKSIPAETSAPVPEPTN